MKIPSYLSLVSDEAKYGYYERNASININRLTRLCKNFCKFSFAYLQMATENQSDRNLSYTQIDIVSWFSWSIVIAILGALMNIVTIVILVVNKEFRSSHYILLLGTALSDIICDSIFIPIEALQSFHWIRFQVLLGNDYFCMFEACGYAIFFSSSILSQMLVCVNRLLAVFTPIFFKSVKIKMAVIAWLCVSILYPSLYHIVGILGGWLTFPIDTWAGDCREVDTNPIAKNVRIISTMYFPMGFTLLGYLAILAKILATTKDKRRIMIQRAKGSLSMFTSMLFYAFCVLPVWIIQSSNKYDDSLMITLWIKFLFRSSYAINPVSVIKFMSEF